MRDGGDLDGRPGAQGGRRAASARDGLGRGEGGQDGRQRRQRDGLGRGQGAAGRRGSVGSATGSADRAVGSVLRRRPGEPALRGSADRGGRLGGERRRLSCTGPRARLRSDGRTGERTAPRGRSPGRPTAARRARAPRWAARRARCAPRTARGGRPSGSRGRCAGRRSEGPAPTRAGQRNAARPRGGCGVWEGPSRAPRCATPRHLQSVRASDLPRRRRRARGGHVSSTAVTKP